MRKRHLKVYDGMVFGNYKVIGTTEIERNHAQMLVVRNLRSQEVKVVSSVNLVSGSINGLGRGRRGTKAPNNSTGFANVYLQKNGPEKGKYYGSVKIKGKSYTTSFFTKPNAAYKAIQEIIYHYEHNQTLPTVGKSKTNTGHKYISYYSQVKRKKKYVVQIYKLQVRQRFLTLQDALTYRNQTLTDHNLPIPD